MNRIDLNGAWAIRGVAPGTSMAEAVAGEWLAGEVPGEVHLDLQRAGVIDDPFYRDNAARAQWVHERDWWYRRTITVDAAALAHDRVELVCEGLDTFATVYLNGAEVGQADNMFRTWRFDARPFVRVGENELLIRFDAPHMCLSALAAEHGSLPGGFNFQDIVQGRKAQYAAGWDWGPFLTAVGIWRPIALECWSGVRLTDVWVRTVELTDALARVEVSVEVEATRPVEFAVAVRLLGPDGDIVDADVRSLPRPDARTLRFAVAFRSPQRWWPAGYGEQPLYQMQARVTQGDDAHIDTVPFGLRTVELVREEDDEGESFVFAVNGVRLFCKGANWIPGDQFLPRVSDAYIRENLRLAHDAGMNMVRVWGGGVYESALFYDECDRLGLLVWQDFLFACGSYPEDPVFRRNVAAEAREAIRALRNHPSLALWCGNNECQWLFPPKKGHQGTRYYEDILPALCAELDPDRPYWPGSPFGPTRDDANAPTHGDHHAWEVWGQNADHLASYYFDCGRFISEFGFQAPPTRPTLDSCLAPEDRTPWSAAFEAHEKMPDGLARPYKYLAQHFPVPADLDAWVYVSQALQCLALRTGIGHWRARKWATAGTLFWQLNDCWPALSWSVVDYQCRPKPSWYEVRRLYAPRFLTLQPVIPPDVHGAWELLRFGRLHTLDLTVHLVNDTLADAPAHVRARLLSLTGEVVWSEERTVVVPTNGALEAMDIPRAGLGDFDPTCHVLVADWSTHPEGEGVVSRDLYTFVEPKHLALTPDALEVTRDGENVTITARALALYVAIDAGSAIPSDAFFHLLPGETRTVALHGEVGDVRVRSLGDVSAR